MPRLVAAMVALGSVAGLCAGAPRAAPSDRIDALNRAFIAHIKTLDAGHAPAAARVLERWDAEYRTGNPEGFVPDALAVLYPEFAAALRAFDEEDYVATGRLLEPLIGSADPFLATNAVYFHARALLERGLLEEAGTFLDQQCESRAALGAYTPYAPHLLFLRAYCAASNLRFDDASRTLDALAAAYADAPEPVRVGARQLALELERRERGTLGEVSTLMGYAAGRLHAADVGERVRTRQAEAVALLDKMIQDAREREQQARQQAGGRNRGGKPAARPQSEPKQVSEVQPGASKVGDLHGVDQADPGEMWGKLPPAERERILQSLRSRFPSRYRELVEQYYRSLAEQK